MNFGEALQALKDGKRVQRSGWNGKGMWLTLVAPQMYSVKHPARGMFAWPGEYHDMPNEDHSFSLLPWIGMKTADDKFVPWLASQTDILAEDWGVL